MWCDSYLTVDEGVIVAVFLQLVSTDRSVSDARSHVSSSHGSAKSKCHNVVVCIMGEPWSYFP